MGARLAPGAPVSPRAGPHDPLNRMSWKNRGMAASAPPVNCAAGARPTSVIVSSHAGRKSASGVSSWCHICRARRHEVFRETADAIHVLRAYHVPAAEVDRGAVRPTVEKTAGVREIPRSVLQPVGSSVTTLSRASCHPYETRAAVRQHGQVLKGKVGDPDTFPTPAPTRSIPEPFRRCPRRGTPAQTFAKRLPKTPNRQRCNGLLGPEYCNLSRAGV